MTIIFQDNLVELIGTYGSDETHALSAWTSTSRDLDESKRARIGKLLNCLAKDAHDTPFEKSALHFLVTADIATHIHCLKHRIGVSINAESARYRELEDKAYIPQDWPANLQERLRIETRFAFQDYHETLCALWKHFQDEGLSNTDARKRAKESARFLLPYNTQIKFDIMFNWRSFMHFQVLRNSPHAQKEVREVAQKMLALVEETGHFPETIAAFKEHRFA